LSEPATFFSDPGSVNQNYRSTRDPDTFVQAMSVPRTSIQTNSSTSDSSTVVFSQNSANPREEEQGNYFGFAHNFGSENGTEGSFVNHFKYPGDEDRVSRDIIDFETEFK